MSKRHHHQQQHHGPQGEQGAVGEVGGTSSAVAQESAVSAQANEGGAAAGAPSPEAGATTGVDELAQARAQAEAWRTKYLYALAEIENMRKRAQKERSELLQFAGQQVLYDLLEVADNFARAIEADRAQSDPKVIVEGIELIYKQLMQVLEKHHVKPITAAGAKFDPTVHEALHQVRTKEAEPGTVVAELQRGYMLRDRVLRPARVVVAAAPEDAGEEAEREKPRGEGEDEGKGSGSTAGSEAN